MEYHSPVYELLHKCELMGMHKPIGWDLMTEPDILKACQAFLGGSHGPRRTGPSNSSGSA